MLCIACTHAAVPSVAASLDMHRAPSCQIALPELRSLNQQEQMADLQRIASVRLYVTGADLRSIPTTESSASIADTASLLTGLHKT